MKYAVDVMTHNKLNSDKSYTAEASTMIQALLNINEQLAPYGLQVANVLNVTKRPNEYSDYFFITVDTIDA